MQPTETVSVQHLFSFRELPWFLARLLIGWSLRWARIGSRARAGAGTGAEVKCIESWVWSWVAAGEDMQMDVGWGVVANARDWARDRARAGWGLGQWPMISGLGQCPSPAAA